MTVLLVTPSSRQISRMRTVVELHSWTVRRVVLLEPVKSMELMNILISDYRYTKI